MDLNKPNGENHDAAGGIVISSSYKLSSRPETVDSKSNSSSGSDLSNAIKNSINDHAQEILKKFGPLKENDPKLSSEFGKEAWQLVLEKGGPANFLKSDGRFGSLGEFIFVNIDAEKALTLIY